jgi:hypothetical protein
MDISRGNLKMKNVIFYQDGFSGFGRIEFLQTDPRI